MNKPTCTVICRSNSPHLQQIYTGFAQLQRRGAIRLKQIISPPEQSNAVTPSPTHAFRHAQLEVLVEGEVRLCYDLHDSDSLDAEHLERADYYFKRSFSPGAGAGGQRAQVFPLGLNYLVYPDFIDRHTVQRSIILGPVRARVTSTLRALQIGPVFAPRLSQLEAIPAPEQQPRVLFMARLWDPYDNPTRPRERVEEREAINEMRVGCIRLLRRELGTAFYGGVAHTAYARRHYSDVLLDNAGDGSQARYLRLLRDFPIAVATQGLYGSTGWKFGEYIACAKAVLSERLNHEAPGALRDGHNYLSFSSPEECVSQALRLIANDELRRSMMGANYTYYQRHLRPDVLVGNTLRLALARSMTF